MNGKNILFNFKLFFAYSFKNVDVVTIFIKGMSPVIIFSMCQFMRYDQKTSYVSSFKVNNVVIKSLLGTHF